MMLLLLLLIAVTQQLDVRIPAGIPVHENTHICMAFNLNEKQEFMEAALVHHSITYLCPAGLAEAQNDTSIIWDCGVSVDPRDSSRPHAPVCEGEDDVYFPSKEDLIFKPGTAYRLRDKKNNDSAQLVMELHFAEQNRHPYVEPVTTGREGISLHFVPAGQVKEWVNTLVLSSDMGLETREKVLPSGQVSHVDLVCRIPENVKIMPISFGTHTHSMGTRVSGWRVTPDGKWTVIGVANGHIMTEDKNMHEVGPNVHGMVIQSGDRIAVRCTYNNTRDENIVLGERVTDEMCEFYLMYSARPEESPTDVTFCSKAGMDWSLDPVLRLIPDSIADLI